MCIILVYLQTIMRVNGSNYLYNLSEIKNDGRSVWIKLSEKSKKYADRMMDISDQLRLKLFFGMSDEEKKISFLLLNKISSNL